VPGIRRPLAGRRQTVALSAVPGSRTRDSENEEGATAGVRSLRMCRRRFEHVWAHSQGGHPREERNGEACIGDGAGRRDARRWPKPHEDDERLTPPQCGEPERRRDERRTRRQAGVGKISPGRVTKADYASSAHENGSRGILPMWYSVTMLFEAMDEASALEAARNHAKTMEIDYPNMDRQDVSWRFVEITEVQDLCEAHISSGTEVHSRLFRRNRLQE
jgi:hypothetical protein